MGGWVGGWGSGVHGAGVAVSANDLHGGGIVLRPGRVIVAIDAKVPEELNGEDRIDAEEDEHDDEGIEDAGDGTEECDDDLVERLDTLEETEDTEGAEQLELGEALVELDAAHQDASNGDDEEVKTVPRAPPELADRTPIAVHVHEQLDKEDDVERDIELVPDFGVQHVIDIGVDLLLDDVDDEIAHDEEGHSPHAGLVGVDATNSGLIGQRFVLPAYTMLHKCFFGGDCRARLGRSIALLVSRPCGSCNGA